MNVVLWLIESDDEFPSANIKSEMKREDSVSKIFNISILSDACKVHAEAGENRSLMYICCNILNTISK